ncbi:MAG: hypothetical protein JXA04_01345 [Gammaproteobacteria bacterium]|nr:hypothetical protein [Gammaproteobacteria bacterium]
MLEVTRDTYDILRYAALYEKGLPPVDGGVLDQTEAFIRAVEFIFNDETEIKNKLGIF